MPDSGNVSSVASLNAVTLVPYIAGVTGPKWQCPTVNIRSGDKPSEAAIHIQLTDADGEKNPVVNCPEFPKGSRVFVQTKSFGNSGAIIFSGYVVLQSREISGGMVRITALDARWLMSGITLTGCFAWSGLAGESSEIVYRAAQPLICNPGGKPNCTMVDSKPVFCEPNLGLGNNETPIVKNGKAGFWTPALLASYFRYVVLDPTAKTKMNDAGVYMPQLNPQQINWPETAFSGINATVDRAFTSERSYEGLTLTAALSKICEESGFFGLMIQPASAQGEADQLRVVSTRFNALAPGAGGGYHIDLNVRDFGPIGSGIFVNGGSIQNSAINASTCAMVNGSPIEIERRTFDTSDFSTKLIPAWTPQEELGWRNFVKGQLRENPLLPAPVPAQDPGRVLAAAWAKYPYVFAAFKIDPAWDFTDGVLTTPLAKIFRAPANRLRSQLAPVTDEPTQPVEVQFETADPNLDPGNRVWRTLLQNTGFRVDDSNVIWFDGLRGDSQPAGNYEANSWQGTIDYDSTNQAATNATVDAVVAVPIRATFVIKADERLQKTVSIGDGTGSPIYIPPGVENNTGGWQPGVARMAYLSNEKYSKQVAKDSYPEPESTGGTVVNADLINNAAQVRNNVEAMADDAFRFGRTANLDIPEIIASIQPGQQIGDLVGATGRIPVRGVVHEVRYVATPESNQTTLACQ